MTFNLNKSQKDTILIIKIISRKLSFYFILKINLDPVQSLIIFYV